MDTANANDRADNRPLRDWLVSGLILIGGILCGWGAGLALFYAGRWFGDDVIWNRWWQISHVTTAYIVVAVVVLAAARYWFRRRPSDTDPGA